jgi:hypothetical protein
MPFTPAHTITVLPFLRVNFLSATGLVIGSMSPDFEYFLKFSVNGTHGHTWAGLLYFDLPVSFILSVVFHSVVRPNLIQNLPGFLRSRFMQMMSFDFLQSFRQNPTGFVVAVLFGGATHILWDGFTHGQGFFVNYFSFYDGAYVPFQGVDYPLWYALQHISTMVGLTILCIYIWFLPVHPAPRGARVIYWILVAMITVFIAGTRFLIVSHDFNLGNFVVSSISGLCIALIICGVLPSRYFGAQRI